MNLDNFKHPLLKRIDEYCISQAKNEFRDRLGMSVISNICPRYSYLNFYWIYLKPITGRQARIFNRGFLEETRIKSYLEGIGVKYLGEQVTVELFDGHFGGSCDGVIQFPDMPPMLLEIKTIKNGADWKNLWELKLERGAFRHYKQMCGYGKNLDLKYGLYICTNKQTEEIYAEGVELNYGLATEMEAQASRIIEGIIPPKHPNATATLYSCKYLCNYYDICFGKAKPNVNCRSCRNSVATTNKCWGCKTYNQLIPQDYIAKGCPEWKYRLDSEGTLL